MRAGFLSGFLIFVLILNFKVSEYQTHPRLLVGDFVYLQRGNIVYNLMNAIPVVSTTGIFVLLGSRGLASNEPVCNEIRGSAYK